MKHTAWTILAVVAVFAFAQVASAASIGVNFRLGTSAEGTIGAANTAGAPGLEQANWNDVSVSSQSWSNENFYNLKDATGTATDMDVNLLDPQAKGDCWKAQVTATTTPDQRLMRFALMEQYFGGSDGLMTMSVTNIPYAVYDVVVYFNHADVSSINIPLRLTIGTTVKNVTIANLGFKDNSYELSDGAGSIGDYVVFSGLTGSSFSMLHQQMSTTYWNGGMTGFQIVESTIPEPATMSLLVFGGVAALIRRRRK